MARASYGFSTLFETMAQVRKSEAESNILNDFATGLMEYSVLDAEEEGLINIDEDTVATGPDDVAIEAEFDTRLDSLIAKIPEDDYDISVSESLIADFEEEFEGFLAYM